MKYAFFPGCVLESAAKEDYLATVAVAKKLGIVTLHYQKKKV